MTAHPLDNPVWESLNGPQASMAVAVGQARAYAPDVARFVGLPTDPGRQAWVDLAALLGPGAVAGLTGSVLTPPPDWTIQMNAAGVQLVATDALEDRPYDQAVVLGEADAEEMTALVARTQPGPWLPKTYLMGGYLGVRREGRLVAMAGERLHPPGWTEISAVCTDPEFRGRGYATQLVLAVAHGIRQRGETPMLHASATNLNAIWLYESLGFVLRKPTTFIAVCVPEIS